jgi:hypothetical protein
MTRDEFINKWFPAIQPDLLDDLENDLCEVQDDAVSDYIEDAGEYE